MVKPLGRNVMLIFVVQKAMPPKITLYFELIGLKSKLNFRYTCLKKEKTFVL